MQNTIRSEGCINIKTVLLSLNENDGNKLTSSKFHVVYSIFPFMNFFPL